MNAPSPSETTALSVATQQTSALMLSPHLMEQMMAVAQSMSEASITVPQHFRGKPGDCLAVVMQATQWNMNPYAVAQKTHVVNGTLGYEAQLVQAVLQATGAIDGSFKYEYRNEGGPNLECRVAAVCRGDRELTWGEWLSMSAVTTKNSPLWKTNPKQQMGYLQVKNWARAFKPGAILGVYTPDELQTEAVVPEKHLGPADVVATAPAAAPAAPTLPEMTADDLAKREAKVREFYGKGKSTEDIVAFYSQKFTVPEAIQKRIVDLQPKPEAKENKGADVQDVKPKVTYAQVAERLNKAADVDHLDEAAILIGEVADAQQRTELAQLYEARLSNLKGE